MTVITHLGLKRTALPDTFPHLIKLYISQDHDSSSLPSASSLTRNQEVKSSLGVPGAHFTPFFLEFFDYLAPSGFISFVSWRYLKVASKRERTGLIQPLPCSSSSPVLTEIFFRLSKYSRKFARVYCYYFALPTHRCNSDLSWDRDYVPLHVNSMLCIHSLSPSLSPPVHSHACALRRLPVHGRRFPQRRAGKLPRGFRAALTRGTLSRRWEPAHYKVSFTTLRPFPSPPPPHFRFGRNPGRLATVYKYCRTLADLRMRLKARNLLSRIAAKSCPHKQ